MSQNEMSGLISSLDNKPELHNKIKAATNLDDMISIFKSEGIKVNKVDLLRSQAKKVLELSDEELESANVNVSYTTDTYGGCATWVFGCCP